MTTFRACATLLAGASFLGWSVMPLLAEFEASANAHDTDRHMAAYARESSLTFVFNGEIVRRWDQLRESQRQWWSDGKIKGSYTYVDGPIFEALGDDAGLTTFLIAARKDAVDRSVVEKRLVHSVASVVGRALPLHPMFYRWGLTRWSTRTATGGASHSPGGRRGRRSAPFTQ